MSNELSQFTQEMIPAVEQEMKSVLAVETHQGDPFYGMMHYHMGWVDENLNPVQTSGGKRVRPLLCLLTCQAAGTSWRQAVPAAASLELVHNFTLIHDDVEDSTPYN